MRMMREIKFRVWDSKEIEMVSDPQATEILLRHNMGWYEKPDSAYKPSELIVMQYTGLKDKNEKEIYEGDVVKCDTFDRMNGEVEWDAFFYWKIELSLDDGDLEIIGNIYENPELCE